MDYINRKLETRLKEYLKVFPVTGITGPRQSGKSTMIRQCLEREYRYVTFDDPVLTDFFHSDPRGFFKVYDNRVIFDEIQKVPDMFPHIKMAVDRDRQNYGKYIITGSSQFSLIKKITESLAGRIGLLSLLPFQYCEIPEFQRDRQLIHGSYPELITRNYTGKNDWYSSYITTYIERDVRNLFNIGNYRDFSKLLQLLAARCSQELNMSTYARELGVDIKTIQSWLSVLEASYIIFLLPSYHKNLGKRIVKRPKIYFFDTGLLCYLTGIDDSEALDKGPLKGSVFENYVVSEIKKSFLHSGSRKKIYYYRSNSGLEADVIIEDPIENSTLYIEIKSNSTPKYEMVKGIQSLMAKEEDQRKITGMLLYKGDDLGRFSDSIKYINHNTFFNEYL